MIEHAFVPIGMLSKENQREMNKNIRKFKENHARKCSRKHTVSDDFNLLLVISDPYVSSISSLHPKHSYSLPMDVRLLLREPIVPVSNEMSEDEEMEDVGCGDVGDEENWDSNNHESD